MQLKWLQDCKTNEEKEKRKRIIGNNKEALDILSKICYNSIVDARKSSSDYSTPNWDYRQADLVGYIRALEEIIKMCDLGDH